MARSIDTEPTAIWVCVDCALVANGYEHIADTEASPWTLYPNAGIGDITDDHDSDTGDGHDSFSATPCEGCGSALAGERFRFADHTRA